jgi:centractin
LNPRANRDQAAQIFFETFNVPAMFTSIQAVLSLFVFVGFGLTCRYASGRTSGVVIDSGDGVTHSVPVYEGFTIPTAIRRIDIAGRDVTEHLQLLLRKAGATLHTSAEKEIVRTIKEKMCYVAEDPRKEEKEWGGVPGSGSGGLHNKGQEYKLPDGRSIKVCILMIVVDESSVQNGFAPLRSCLIRKSLGQSIKGFMRCYSTQ